MTKIGATTVKLIQMGGQLFFGSYKLLQTLGEGEFGKVKLATLENGQQFAIKFVKKSILTSENRREKLAREISILQSLKHANIVKLFTVLESEKYIGLVMEYASGGELFDHILAKKHLSEKESRRYFTQLISGVQYLHDNNIIHRDLKLENLLLDGQGHIRITDFGFANHSLGPDSLMSTSCGSPCYAAPELVLSDSYVGTAADIWSCGVILYAMLCGYLPFDDDPTNPDSSNVHLLYKYILKTSLKFPSWVSTSARDLLKHLLSPDPKERLNMDQLLSHPWMQQPAVVSDTKENDVPMGFVGRGRAASAPIRPPDDKLVISIPPVFKKSPILDKLPSPLLPFSRAKFNGKFQTSTHTIIEEESPVTSPVNSASPNMPTLTPTSGLSMFSSITSSITKDRTVSNPESVNSIEDVFEQLVVKDHKGALDPKTVTTRHTPTELIEIVIESITHESLDSSKAIFRDGVLSISRKSEVAITCTWHLSELPKPITPVSPMSNTLQANTGGVGERRRSSVGAQMKNVANSIKASISQLKKPFLKNDVKFTINACSVPNLEGVYCLDIRRLRGDKWEFKKLYDEIVSLINL